jgi:selenocysteine lyase/cysteine desulfurase
LADFGIIVKSAAIHAENISLDLEDFASKLTPKTKVVAGNWATNSCGTVTDVKKCIALARQKASPDVITIVDAVHAAPHKFIDVKDIDTDVLLCSAYKFFGPHLGVWYTKKETGERIKSVRVLSYDNTDMPWKFETGTPAMELANGAGEAVEFIADIGRKYGDEYKALAPVELSGLREDIWLGMKAIEVHEDGLSAKLRQELPKIPGLKLYGATDPKARTSTVSFAVDGINAGDIATYLGEKGIFVWDGDFYAIETINNVLGMQDVGGLVRIGMAAYNTEQEIDYTIATIKEYIESRR